MKLCAGCWIDLTVDEYLRAWSTDPQVGRALTYRGIPLAATLEYDLLQELIAVFSRLVPGVQGGARGQGSGVSGEVSGEKMP